MQIIAISGERKLQYSLQGPDVSKTWSRISTAIVVSDAVDTTSRKSACRTVREIYDEARSMTATVTRSN